MFFQDNNGITCTIGTAKLLFTGVAIPDVPDESSCFIPMDVLKQYVVPTNGT